MDTEMTPDEFRARQSAGEAVDVTPSRSRVVREATLAYTIQKTTRGGAVAAGLRSVGVRKQTSPGEVRTAHSVA